jgi:DNA-binding MarR family transcriptional regulator
MSRARCYLHVVRAARVEVDSGLCAEAARTCASFNFRKATRAVTALFDEILEPTSLRSTQLVVLIAIHLGEPISLPSLARELVLDRTTLIRNLQPLIAAKLIATSQSQRSRMFRLTDKGRERIESALPYWQKAQERFVAQFGQANWKTMLPLLSAAVNAAKLS